MYLVAISHKMNLPVNNLNYEVWCFGNISTSKGDLLPKACSYQRNYLHTRAQTNGKFDKFCNTKIGFETLVL